MDRVDSCERQNGKCILEMQPVKCILGNALSDGSLNAPRKTDAEKTGYSTRAV